MGETPFIEKPAASVPGPPLLMRSRHEPPAIYWWQDACVD